MCSLVQCSISAESYLFRLTLLRCSSNILAIARLTTISFLYVLQIALELRFISSFFEGILLNGW
jgi:hypothetical protein